MAMYTRGDLLRASNSFELVNAIFNASEAFQTRKLDACMYAILQVHLFTQESSSSRALAVESSGPKRQQCLWFSLDTSDDR